VWYLRGVASLHLGIESAAQHDFSQMIALGGDIAEAVDASGTVHREQGNWKAAAADYARLRTHSDYRTRMAALRPEALLRLKAEDHAGFVELCVSMSREAPKIPNVYLADLLQTASIGQCDVGPMKVLTVQGEKAHADHPGDTELVLATGCSLYRAGRYPDSTERLENLLHSENELDSLDTIHLLLFLAMAHQRMNHAQLAQNYLKEAQVKSTAYLRTTHEIADVSEVWAPRMELELLLTEAISVVDSGVR
jgi:tetratricopeptide (TPR) repeat protein